MEASLDKRLSTLLADRYQSACSAVRRELSKYPDIQEISGGQFSQCLSGCKVIFRKRIDLSTIEDTSSVNASSSSGAATSVQTERLPEDTKPETPTNFCYVEVGLPKYFPDDPPIAGASRPDGTPIENPHIENSGLICVIPEFSAVNSNDPAGLVLEVFDRATEIVRGTGADEYRSEFAHYWLRDTTLDAKTILLLDVPENCAEGTRVAFLKSSIVVASTDTKLDRWLSNRFGDHPPITTTDACLWLPLNQPLIPDEFPQNLGDLIRLAEHAGAGYKAWIEDYLCQRSDRALVLLAQNEGDIAASEDNPLALAGVSFRGLSLVAKASKEVTRGFRPGKIPQPLALSRGSRLIREAPISRCPVQRVDHQWVHTRGGDGTDLSEKSVLLIGAGSLGGYVGHFLSRAGIGNLTIVDKQSLAWDNTGRHVLGAGEVYDNKAEGLAAALRRDMPHLKITGVRQDWRDLYTENPSLFSLQDLIVSTTGDWRCEASLNLLSRQAGFPPILFGWLEPYAVAGHALLVNTNGGCLQCGSDDFGHFGQAVSKFTDTTLTRDSSGCTMFQKYGAVSLAPVASMISSMVVDSISNTVGAGVGNASLQPPSRSRLATWVSSREHFLAVQAKIDGEWLETLNEAGFERIYRKQWKLNRDCPVCNPRVATNP